MSYENGTLHYNLPQTVGNDKRDWFDTNEPFAKIDADLWTVKGTAEGNTEALAALNTRVGALEQHDEAVDDSITNLTARVSACEQAITTLTTELADARQDFKDAICTYDEGTATLSTRSYQIGEFFWYNDTLYRATAVINVGAAIVPNTNCVTTTITAELLS